jgi:hypothetical protein
VTVIVATGEVPEVGEINLDKDVIEYWGDIILTPEFYLEVTAF